MAHQTDGLGSTWVENVTRTADFWRRATSIYLSYKGAQVHAAVLGGALSKSADEVQRLVWEPQHEAAGAAMYDLCVTLRGFYLKAGQFLGSRNDFVPDPICKRLCVLCDQVPPMSADKAAAAIKRELGTQDLSDVFEWIQLDKPLGSASIAQVHKAKLRSFSAAEVKAARAARRAAPPSLHTVAPGQQAWDVCNQYGVSLHQLVALNKGVSLEALRPGQVIRVPPSLALDAPQGGSQELKPTILPGPPQSRGERAVAAVLQAQASGEVPEDGLVAVKVQYPGALSAMSLDLQNLRAAAFFLSKTELRFDLVSAIDELNKQIRLEFDFVREARVMDSIALHLRGLSDRIQVPRSIPGLVSKELLVMHFLSGVPLIEAGKRIRELTPLQQQQGKRRIMDRVSEAYGQMLLGEGLFQADGHPGNILVGQGGRIGLLDYGQSKQLSPHHKLGLARLVIEMDRGDVTAISSALGDLGVVTDKDDAALRAEMAYGMFDTRLKVDPFDPKSPLKQSAIVSFPPDMFFVLRVVQLLRGMSSGMGIEGFSTARQWAPLARAALRRAEKAQPDGENGGAAQVLSRVLKVALWPMPQLISRVNGGR